MSTTKRNSKDCIRCFFNFSNYALSDPQLFTKRLKQTLVFMRNCKIREKLISIFQQSFASINNIFTFRGGLGTRL